MDAILRDLGYLTASRRHHAGPGDVLAIPTCPEPSEWIRTPRPLLVEVKGTKDPPWRSGWGPEARAEMIEAGVRWGVEPILAWWPPGLAGPSWLTVADWP